MLVKTLALSLFLGSAAFAGDSWLCTSESSELRGDSVAACGIGEAKNEGDARKMAFDRAKIEFNGICGPGTECGDNKYTVNPKRTSCEESGGLWKCYRLVVFRVKNVARREAQKPGIIAQQSSGKFKLSNEELINMAIRKALEEM